MRSTAHQATVQKLGPQFVWMSIVVALVVSTLMPGLSPAALAQGTGTPGQGLFLPFAPHQTWYVCQGYFGTVSGTHNNTHALDLTLDPNGFGTSGCYGSTTAAQSYSAGQSILAPGAGVVAHRGTDLVCLDLDVGGSLKIGHMTSASRVAAGRVDALDVLGVVAPHAASNGQYSHIHIEAFSDNACTTGSDVPLTGAYRFFGVPDLPSLRPISAVTNFSNHYFGTSFSNLMVQRGTDDAGTHGSGCTNSTGNNEIYLGNCPSGTKIYSGARFEHLPAYWGDWISAASLVVQTDGTYSNAISVDIQGEKKVSPATFSSTSMPSNRLSTLTTTKVRWSISDTWVWLKTRDTRNLRGILQEIVDLSGWTSGSSKVSLILSGASTSSTTHRRFMAYERDATHADPLFNPARLIVTQYRTKGSSTAYRGNNPPVSNAGPNLTYTTSGQVITLNGSSSFDPDGNAITYKWTQVSGPTVTLNNSTSANASFTVGAYGETYAFDLRVQDNGLGQLRHTDQVLVSFF